MDIHNVEYSLVWAFIIFFKVHVIFFLVLFCDRPSMMEQQYSM